MALTSLSVLSRSAAMAWVRPRASAASSLRTATVARSSTSFGLPVSSPLSARSRNFWAVARSAGLLVAAAPFWALS